MKIWRAMSGCVCILLAQGALAQGTSSIPVKPAGSGTLVVKPKSPKPPPPVPDPNCVPGAVCTPKPDPAKPTRPQPRTDADASDAQGASEVPPPRAVDPATAPAGGTTTAPAAPTAAASRAGQAARELLVASTDIAESDAQRQWFAQQGIGVLRRRTLANLGWVLTVYRIPPATDLPTLLAAFTSQWPQSEPEENQRYLPQAQPDDESFDRVHYAAALIGMPAGCARRIDVAMLDGPVNVALPAFATRGVRSIDIAERGPDPAYAHATAIAAILLGTGELPGLVPNARLLSVNVFAVQRGKPYTTTEWILRGLDAVLGQTPRPSVVNLSFGGGQSVQLGRAIARVLEHAHVVAAAGNDGATQPVYPAAYPGVVAVTAVDARQRRWPRANAGEFISIAAPGVDVWTIDGNGNGYYASGTSFAAAYVTAALALGAPEQKAVPTWLRLHAGDLGSPGRDRLFGFGLIQAGGLCP